MNKTVIILLVALVGCGAEAEPGTDDGDPDAGAVNDGYVDSATACDAYAEFYCPCALPGVPSDACAPVAQDDCMTALSASRTNEVPAASVEACIEALTGDTCADPFTMPYDCRWASN